MHTFGSPALCHMQDFYSRTTFSFSFLLKLSDRRAPLTSSLFFFPSDFGLEVTCVAPLDMASNPVRASLACTIHGYLN